MKSENPRKARLYLDVVAAYNRDELPMSSSGMDVQSIEEIMAHPYYWAYLSESETEEVLLQLYVQRRCLSQ